MAVLRDTVCDTARVVIYDTTHVILRDCTHVRQTVRETVRVEQVVTVGDTVAVLAGAGEEPAPEALVPVEQVAGEIDKNLLDESILTMYRAGLDG